MDPVAGDAWTTFTFKAPGGTLEMPMTDTAQNPNATTQFSPSRAYQLGRDVPTAIAAVIPQLKAYRGYA